MSNTIVLDGIEYWNGPMPKPLQADIPVGSGNSTPLARLGQRWRCMWYRCYNPANDSYKDHGARGIRVCIRWLSFANYLADIGGIPGNGMTVDRTNNDWHYTPENCRIVTQQEQLLNRRIPKHNTTGYRGVRIKKPGIYVAKITVNDKSIYLSSSSNPEIAAAIFNSAVLHFRGPGYEAQLNDVTPKFIALPDKVMKMKRTK